MKNNEIVLVTGGTGAVGVECILQLLKKGYPVRTTLRLLSKKNDVIGMLKAGGLTSFDQLTFVETELMKDDNWHAAIRGCTYVLHVASPTHTESEDDDVTIRPAVEGVLRVLKIARDEGVKRVVLTSSFGALGFSNHDRNTVTTEANWTNPHEKGLSAYEKSKTLSERAAWDFMQQESGTLELATINPVAILGPSLGPSKSPSLGLLKMLLSGSIKAIPNIPLNVVDIRDVADLHIRAMVNPEAAGQRFIATADGEISLLEIAKLLKNKMPAISAKVPVKTIPKWVLSIGALFSGQAKHGVLFLKINRRLSNAKAKQVLGWKPIGSNEDAVLAAVESMIKFENIK